MNQHRLAWVNSPRTESLVMAVILLNAVILTAETMASGSTLQALKWADKACLAFFLAEIYSDSQPFRENLTELLVI